jgi:hypothetical protein
MLGSVQSNVGRTQALVYTVGAGLSKYRFTFQAYTKVFTQKVKNRFRMLVFASRSIPTQFYIEELEKKCNILPVSDK